METISISSLKTNLSAILKKVASGVTYTVMDRKQPVAEVIPLQNKKLSVIPPSVKVRVIKNRFSGKINLDPYEIIKQDRGNRF